MAKRKGRECIVPFCTAKVGCDKLLSFHELPSNKLLRDQWLNNISRGQEGNSSKAWTPSTDRDSVCSLHFLTSDYREGIKRRCLKSGAIPTVFPHYPKYKVPKETQKRPSPKKRHMDTITSFPLTSANCDTFVNNNENATEEASEIRKSASMKSSVLQDPLNGEKKTVVMGPILIRRQIRASILRTWKARENKHLQCIRRLNAKIKAKDSEIAILKNNSDYREASKIGKLKQAASDNCTKSKMIIEQINAYDEKSHQWSEFCVRMCVLWYSKSPRAYKIARNLKLFCLPSVSTLRRYIGPSTLQH